MSENTNTEREAFESALKSLAAKHWETLETRDFVRDSSGEYENGFMEVAWSLWQARASLPTAQADSQPAPDEIINMAREQGLPETEIEGVFRVNVDDLGRMFAADRAARAPADSVTVLADGAGPVAIKVMAYGGSTGINDYLMSDGTVKAMRPSEVKWATQPAPTPPAQTADSVLEDGARYRLLRRGQHWSVIDGIGNDLRAEALDAAVDAARKQGGAT